MSLRVNRSRLTIEFTAAGEQHSSSDLTNRFEKHVVPHSGAMSCWASPRGPQIQPDAYFAAAFTAPAAFSMIAATAFGWDT